jgi:hypothetical protein
VKHWSKTVIDRFDLRRSIPTLSPSVAWISILLVPSTVLAADVATPVGKNAGLRLAFGGIDGMPEGDWQKKMSFQLRILGDETTTRFFKIGEKVPGTWLRLSGFQEAGKGEGPDHAPQLILQEEMTGKIVILVLGGKSVPVTRRK